MLPHQEDTPFHGPVSVIGPFLQFTLLPPPVSDCVVKCLSLYTSKCHKCNKKANITSEYDHFLELSSICLQAVHLDEKTTSYIFVFEASGCST